MTEIIDENYLPLPEAVKYSGYSYFVLYNAIRKENLYAIHFRGRWYIHRPSLDRFVSNSVGRPRK